MANAQHDIAPELLEQIREAFSRNIEESDEIQRLYQAIQAGTATYAEAEQYGIAVGEALAQAFREYLSSADLPHGKLYYNLADRVVRPLLEEDFELVAAAAAQVQKSLNKKAGIGLAVQTAEVDDDRVDGIINSLSNADQYDDIAWLLEEPLVNFSLAAVTDTLKKNFEFQGKAGLSPKIVRKAEGKCCKWCRSLAGVHEYPASNKDIFRRHQRCRCSVTYDPGDGRRQNVWTRQFEQSKSDSKTESRQIMGLKVNGTTVKKCSNHALEQLSVRNVTGERLADALQNPLHISKIQTDRLGRQSFQVIGQKATMVICPQTGKVLSAWPTHRATAAQYRKGRKRK